MLITSTLLRGSVVRHRHNRKCCPSDRDADRLRERPEQGTDRAAFHCPRRQAKNKREDQCPPFCLTVYPPNPPSLLLVFAALGAVTPVRLPSSSRPYSARRPLPISTFR